MVKSLRTCQNRGRKRKMGEGVAEPRRCPISGRIWKEPKYEDHLPPRTDSNNNSRVQKRTPRGLDRTGTLVLILFLFFSLRPSRSIYQSRLTVSLRYQGCFSNSNSNFSGLFYFSIPSHSTKARGFHEVWASERPTGQVYRVEHLVALRRRNMRLDSITRTRGNENPSCQRLRQHRPRTR